MDAVRSFNEKVEIHHEDMGREFHYYGEKIANVLTAVAPYLLGAGLLAIGVGASMLGAKIDEGGYVLGGGVGLLVLSLFGVRDKHDPSQCQTCCDREASWAAMDEDQPPAYQK